MRITDQEIDRKARQLIARHSSQAAMVAVARLNQCIDQRDWTRRDTWARIVHRIHESQNQLQGDSSGRASSDVANNGQR